MSNKKIVLGAALLTSGLSAGLLYGWSVSVIPGLTLLNDKDFIVTLQAINGTIQNPWFFLIFMGAAVLTPLAAFTYRKHPSGLAKKLLIAAAGIYFVGVLSVTAAGNLPLSDQLDMVTVNTMSTTELAEARDAYETTWNTWHAVRTIAATTAFVCVIAAAFTIKRDEAEKLTKTV